MHDCHKRSEFIATAQGAVARRGCTRGATAPVNKKEFEHFANVGVSLCSSEFVQTIATFAPRKKNKGTEYAKYKEHCHNSTR